MSARPFVLIVDDDEDLREVVASLVSLIGMETETADHGQAALAVMERRTPNLILLDMKMPVMSGWEFCAELSRRGERRPPILVLTAAPDPAARAREVGAEGWLGKPFETDALLGLVKTLVQSASAGRT